MALAITVVVGKNLIPVALATYAMASTRSAGWAIGICFGVLMATWAMSLHRITWTAIGIDQWCHRLQMRWIDAVLVHASSRRHMIKLRSIRDRSNKQFPHQAVAQWALTFPVGQGVTVLTDRVPQPASRGSRNCDLLLESFGQVKEVHKCPS